MGNASAPDFDENFARQQVTNWRAKYEAARAAGNSGDAVKAAASVDAAETRLNEITRKNRGR
jgi:hypothetical protein